MRPTTPLAASPRARYRSALFLTLSLGCALVAGCAYRMPILQGNFLDPGQVEQLQDGMTRSQVMFLLGTPMVPSGFDADRWDYYYYVKARRLQSPQTRRLTVYFKDDKVERVDKTDQKP
jgi:outer membrane protein assembly factor BamE